MYLWLHLWRCHKKTSGQRSESHQGILQTHCCLFSHREKKHVVFPVFGVLTVSLNRHVSRKLLYKKKKISLVYFHKSISTNIFLNLFSPQDYRNVGQKSSCNTMNCLKGDSMGRVLESEGRNQKMVCFLRANLKFVLGWKFHTSWCPKKCKQILLLKSVSICKQCDGAVNLCQSYKHDMVSWTF